MKKKKSIEKHAKQTTTSMNPNTLHPPPATLTSIPIGSIDPEIQQFIESLSTAKLTINTNLPTITTQYNTNHIQMSPTNIDHEIFAYNQFYNEKDLFGRDSNGNVVIGALKSPKHEKSNSLSQSLTNEEYSEIFAFPDTGNTNNEKSIEILKECQESDDNIYDNNNNNMAVLLEENKSKITENIRKRRKRKHTKTSSSLSSIDLPEPRQSSLELKIEEDKFDEQRQKYIADMIHKMFSDDEDYNDHSDQSNDCKYDTQPETKQENNFEGHILELDTKKILKGINKKKSVLAVHRPSQLCLQKTVICDESIDKSDAMDKYHKMEQELDEWKKQYTELNKQYSGVLEKNDKLTDDMKNMNETLQKSENECMLLLLNAQDNTELMEENNKLKHELKKYKNRAEAINDQITWLHTKYELGKRGKYIEDAIGNNQSETDDDSDNMFVGMKQKHKNSSTMIFNEDSVNEIQQLKPMNSNESESSVNVTGCNKFLLNEMKGESHGEIELEDDYKFVSECRNMFKDGNILGATMNMELIETCHRSVTMFHDMKGKFVEFVKQSESIQVLFDNLQKSTDMDVNSKMCEYDEIYKLWIEFIGNAKDDIKGIENMKKEPLNYIFYDGMYDDNYSDIEYDFDDESGKSIDGNNNEKEYEDYEVYEEEYDENDMHYNFEFMMDVN